MAEDTNLALQGVTQGLESLKMSLGGISSGLQNMAAQMASGGRSVMGGMSSMFGGGGLPTSQFQQVPGIMAMPRHGMHISNMSLGRDMGMMSGFGTPPMGMYASEAMDLAGRDVGNRFGGAATMGGIFGTGAAASWFGYDAMAAMMPKSLGASGFFSGWGMSGAGGSLLKFGAPLLGSVGISMAFEKAAKDVQEHMAMVNYMRDSSFRYAFGGGPEQDPRSGVGFSRGAAGDIARGARGIATEDLSLDMGDVTGIIDKGTQLGLFRGANTSEAFLGKVKELASAVKKVSRTLKMSLDEGMTAMAEMDQMGITNPAAMGEFARRSDVIGAASGYTGQEMFGFGRMAGEMARGSWINQAAAGGMMQQNIMAGTFLQNKGILSAEAIAQGGGIVNISQGLTQASMASVNNPYLNTIMMGMAAGGGSNIMGALAGGAGPTEMMARTMGAMSSPGQFIRANINRDETINAVSKMFGGQGMESAMLMAAMGEAKEMAPLYGVSRKEYLQFSLENRYGLNTSQSDLLIGKMENFSQIRADMMKQEEISRVREQRETLIRDYSVTGMAGRAAGRLWNAAVVNPLTRVADTISGGFETAALAVGDANVALGALLAGESSTTAGRGVSASARSEARINFAAGGGRAFRAVGTEDAQGIRDYTTTADFRAERAKWSTSAAFGGAATMDEASHLMFKTNYTRLTYDQKVKLGAHLRDNNTEVYNLVEKNLQRTSMEKMGLKGSIERMEELRYEKSDALDRLSQAALPFGGTTKSLLAGDASIDVQGYLTAANEGVEEVYLSHLRNAKISKEDIQALKEEKKGASKDDIRNVVNRAKEFRRADVALGGEATMVGAEKQLGALRTGASSIKDAAKQKEVYKDLGVLGEILGNKRKGTKAEIAGLKDLSALGDEELNKAIQSGDVTQVRDYFGKKGEESSKGIIGTWWDKLTEGKGEKGGQDPSGSLASKQLEFASQMEQMIIKFRAFGYEPNVPKPG